MLRCRRCERMVVPAPLDCYLGYGWVPERRGHRGVGQVDVASVSAHWFRPWWVFLDSVFLIGICRLIFVPSQARLGSSLSTTRTATGTRRSRPTCPMASTATSSAEPSPTALAPAPRASSPSRLSDLQMLNCITRFTVSNGSFKATIHGRNAIAIHTSAKI